MTERFPQSDDHLSLIGIRNKIDQEFLQRWFPSRRAKLFSTDLQPAARESKGLRFLP
tara:strand:+ start:62666 stop:62836 length:171 start_codon:yes stop_codon:yes gene_type:complete